MKPIPVAVAKPHRGNAFAFYSTTASLEAEFRAEIRAKASGVIQALFIEEGDLVEEGTVLLKLDDRDQQLQLKQARLSFEQAEKEFKRHTLMKDTGILSDEIFEQSENKFLKASADLEIAQQNLSYTNVTAPLSGVCVNRNVDLGAHIDMGTSLFDIMDMDPLMLRIHVPANRMSQIKLNQNINMVIDSTGDSLIGKIHLISPIVDPETGTIKVTAAVDVYPDTVRPGDFAEVRLITEQKKDAILVPSIAVFEEKGQKILFMAVDGKAVIKNVETGLTTENETEIISGVNENDDIVIKGQRNLRDGQQIVIMDDKQDSTKK